MLPCSSSAKCFSQKFLIGTKLAKLFLYICTFFTTGLFHVKKENQKNIINWLSDWFSQEKNWFFSFKLQLPSLFVQPFFLCIKVYSSEGCCCSGLITKSFPSSKIVQMQSYIESNLPSKIILDHRSSSFAGCLPSKGIQHQ